MVCGGVVLKSASPEATSIDRWSTLGFIASFLREPMLATHRLHADHGPFVRLDYPLGSANRPNCGYAVADSGLLRSMLSATDVWRNVKINFTGLPNHTSKRLSVGMTRLRGARHEHYRKLIATPLKKPAIAAMAPEMARLAADDVRQWPQGVKLDLPLQAKNLATVLAVGLLFGADSPAPDRSPI